MVNNKNRGFLYHTSLNIDLIKKKLKKKKNSKRKKKYVTINLTHADTTNAVPENKCFKTIKNYI